ncbi:MAG: flippase-like domain-containing protein [Planctomycetes bacterium]|nr:flippase-like domain-containing protein [Planctomycetota bacterium]
MKRRFTRWLMPLLRYGLCAAAIVYIVQIVSWYDQVRLNDPAKSRVRLLEEHDDRLVIERDGQPETITWDDINYEDDVPDIKYGIRDVVHRMDRMTGLLAILLFFPVPILQSIRLVWMLAVQDVRLSYWNSFKLSYAGNFFNFALPGFFGGDLIKAYYVTRFTHQKTEAVTTVFLDRLIGLSGLMIVASVTFIFAWNRGEWSPTYRNTLATGLALIWGGLCMGCIFLFSRRLRHLIKLPQLAERMPAADQFLRIGRATVAVRQHKALVLLALLNTVVLQLIVVIAAYVMSQALGMQGHFTLYFVFVPIGFLIAAIPISPPNAFGVMEAAYVKFFTVGGLNAASAAVAFALANRLTQLVWALPGVLVPLLGAHLPSHAELQALEQPDPEEANNFSDDEDGTSFTTLDR